jgi:3-hydroxybutyryl-CoA dehydratase
MIAFQITEKDVEQYAVISGDYNPIHLDMEAAKQQGFTNKIAHGMLTVAKVLSVLSNESLIPQELLSQCKFTFISPVYVGDLVTLTIKQAEHKIRVEGKCGEKIVVKGCWKVVRGNPYDLNRTDV